MAITINEGTQTGIATDAVGTLNYQIVKLNVGAAGADSLFTNTLGTVQNLNKGTITRIEGGTIGALAVGTITAGTLTNLATGTVSTIGLIHADRWATVVSSGTSTLGTIKAAVSGSAIYITDITISAGTATNVVVASGGTSTPILGTLFFSTNGGMVGNFRNPLNTVSGSALVYKQSVDGALTITASGYVD